MSSKKLSLEKKLNIFAFLTSLLFVIAIVQSFFIITGFKYIGHVNETLMDEQLERFNLQTDLQKRGIVQGQINHDAKPYSIEQMEEFQKYTKEQEAAEEQDKLENGGE